MLATTAPCPQGDALLSAARGKRRPRLRLYVDLTSIPKTGKRLPFVRLYNDVHGIHVVVLYAVFGPLKFLVGSRVYRGTGTPSPLNLALHLFGSVPDDVKRRFNVWVLADSGFESAQFMQGVRDLGFEFVVGVRKHRKTNHPILLEVSDCAHGAWINLDNWNKESVTLARTLRGERTFFSVCSQLLDGDEMSAEGARRWATLSFFREGKHQFGLAQFALRTETGFGRHRVTRRNQLQRALQAVHGRTSPWGGHSPPLRLLPPSVHCVELLIVRRELEALIAATLWR